MPLGKDARHASSGKKKGGWCAERRTRERETEKQSNRRGRYDAKNLLKKRSTGRAFREEEVFP